MFCSTCGAQIVPHGVFCRGCGNRLSRDGELLGSTVNNELYKFPVTNSDGNVPEGVKGWSWGAFLLNWIWAIGNRSWIGLLALLPYIGWIFAFWLGFKGREMAWKNKKWESFEHFERVQRRWSNWAIGLTLGTIVFGILGAIAIPAYQDYVQRARAAQREHVLLEQTVKPDTAAALAAHHPLRGSSIHALRIDAASAARRRIGRAHINSDVLYL